MPIGMSPTLSAGITRSWCFEPSGAPIDSLSEPGRPSRPSRKRRLWSLPRPRLPKDLANLVVLGILSEAIYAATLLAFPLSRYFHVPLLDLGKLTEHAPLQGVLYLVAISLLFYLWFWSGLDATPPSAFRVVASIVVILPQVGLWLWQHATRRMHTPA